MFPHPLGMVCHAGGLAVSYPGAGIDGSSGHIMGGGVSKTGDFIIGHSKMSQFPASKLAGYSSWFITAEFREGDAVLKTSFGHGSPYVYGKLRGGNPRIIFADQPVIWHGKEGDAFLGVTVRGNHYALFGSSGSRWTGVQSLKWTNESSAGYFSIALLPDKQDATLLEKERYLGFILISGNTQKTT